MKRHGNLYSKIITFENLLTAAKKAQRGKRFRGSVLVFNDNLESELLQLQRELNGQTYQPGLYKTFDIYEPKHRIISAAPYRDRVVHHALCNVIVPIFERTFISTTYANRVGYGSHRALKQFIRYVRSSSFILQCDICKYFLSVDHEILKTQIRCKIKCPQTLWLIDRILDNGRSPIFVAEYFPGDNLLTPLERPKGLPVGNLTSQILANVALPNLVCKYTKNSHRILAVSLFF